MVVSYWGAGAEKAKRLEATLLRKIGSEIWLVIVRTTTIAVIRWLVVMLGRRRNWWLGSIVVRIPVVLGGIIWR